MSKLVSILSMVMLGASAVPARAVAQEQPHPTIDVKSVELLHIRSGGLPQLLLIGTNGRKHLLPDGTFRSESGAMIIVFDGRIASVAAPRGRRVEVESMRVERGGTISLIGTNGIVGPISVFVPDGRYTTREGAMITIKNGAITQASIK